MRKRIMALTAVAALAVTACGSDPASDETVQLRFAWWGAEARNAVTADVINLFEAKYPKIKINAQISDFSGHMEQLATQMAAGSPPDIFQTVDNTMVEYQQQLLDLSGVDQSDFDPTIVAAGRVDGKQLGVAVGVNSQAIMVNVDYLKAAGVELTPGLTWEEFAETMLAVSKTRGVKAWGTGDLGWWTPPFEVWLRQKHDVNFFTDDGKLAFTPQHLTEYWTMIQGLRASGAQAPSDVTTEYGGQPERAPSVTGVAGVDYAAANAVGNFDKLTDDKITLMRLPGESVRAGQWLQPSLFLSAAKDTKHPEEVALFIDFFVNNVDAGKALGFDRGVAPNAEVRKALTAGGTLSEADLALGEYISELQQAGLRPRTPPPAGAGEIQELFGLLNDEIGFGKTSINDAVSRLFAESQRILG